MLLIDDELCTKFIKASVILADVAGRVCLFWGIVTLTTNLGIRWGHSAGMGSRGSLPQLQITYPLPAVLKTYQRKLSRTQGKRNCCKKLFIWNRHIRKIYLYRIP